MTYTLQELEASLNDPLMLDSGAPLPTEAQHIFEHALALLERGEVRAAMRDADGTWRAVPWVKRAILLGFRIGRVAEMSGCGPFQFFDKHTFPARSFRTENGIRIVPGGSTVRPGRSSPTVWSACRRCT